MIEVVAPGPLCTVQDLGRPGLARLAVPRSGPFDRDAAARANRLVGNAADAALLEVTLGGLELVVLDAVTVACTGAPCPGPPGWGEARTLAAGTRLRLGPPERGLRSYLAFRGGIDVPPVLGSRSTDTLSGLGPPRVRAGDRLAVGSHAPSPVGAGTSWEPAGPDALRIRLGPRDDWFEPRAIDLLVGESWTVRPDSDRIGIRLDGPVLPRRVHAELPSEASLPGALQVPPDGRPILFGPDAPVTGGYPVIGVVPAADLDHAAQLRPGDRLRFVLVG